jgi:YVTN family beta-propeller protein
MVSFLLAVVVVGCGSGPGKIGERDGERDAANEETTAPEEQRTTAETAQEPIGFDAEVVSPLGQANLPAGFGEGSLWATDFKPIPAACDDVVEPGEGPCSASASASASASPAGGLKTLLRRLDPQTGEQVATIPLEGLNDVFTQVAFGAGSVWVSSGYYSMGPPEKRSPGDVVFRIDPQTNQVVDRIPVDPPTALAFGHGSIWVTSASYGTVTRIDPETSEVVAKIEVGRAPLDIAVDESSGAVWVASAYLPKDYGGYDIPEHSPDNNLSRVDPEMNKVVAELPIRDSPDGGADKVAVGEGAVWVQSVDGKLLKVDPETNEITAMVSVGDWSSNLAVYGGAVWSMVQAGDFRLVRVDPRTMHVVASEDIGPIPRIGTGGLAAGGGYVWFSSGDGLARIAP